MTMPSFDSIHLVDWLQRWRSGDSAARDEILRASQLRLESLARKMLRGDRVRRWEDTADVVVDAQLRLLRSLETMPPPTSTKAFFRLAAMQIRRSLCDLARRYYGERGLGRHHASHPEIDRSENPAAVVPDSRGDDPADLLAWSEFHDLVETLPDVEREVVDLCFYGELNYSEAAAQLGVTHTTVRKRFNRAMRTLRQAFGDRSVEI